MYITVIGELSWDLPSKVYKISNFFANIAA